MQACGAWGPRGECRLRIAPLRLNIEIEDPQHYLKAPSPAGRPLPQERPRRVRIWYLLPHTHLVTTTTTQNGWELIRLSPLQTHLVFRASRLAPPPLLHTAPEPRGCQMLFL